jgi:ribosome-binding factor A
VIPNRLKRVSHLIKEIVSDVIRNEMKDPRIGFVTVTDVEVAPDLRAAKVFVSVLGDESQREITLKGLNSGAGFVHQRVKEQLTIKRIPSLIFVSDPSIERGVRLCSVIDSVRAKDAEQEK